MVRGWVRLIPEAGSTDPAQPPPTVEVKVDPLGLPPGEYCNLVEVTAPGAVNSPLNFCVVMLVSPSDAILAPVVQPENLVFSAAYRGPSPPAQTLKLYNLSPQPLTLRSSADFGSASKWLDWQPAEATVRPGEPVSFSVRPDLSALNPGAYSTGLTFRFGQNGPPVVVPVQAIVLPAAAAALRSSKAAAAAQCTPAKLLPAFTALGQNFNIQAGWPVPLEVFVMDDCAAPMASGSVVASFTNGDPPLNLSSVQPGRWSGTWPARNARPSGMTISVRALQPDKRIEGSAQVSGSLQEASDVPIVSAGGVVSAVSFDGGSQGPGSYVAIFGQKLSEGLGVASSLPLQLRMRGTEVFMSGRTIPILFTSEGQVNAMVPFELKPNGRHQVIVRRGHCMSVPEPLEILLARPAVFSVDGSGKGQGHVYKAGSSGEFVLAQPGSPAAAGDPVVLYASGLGQVDPAVESGAAAPSGVVSRTLSTVGVTIGGKSAVVQFSGLAPGFAGLFQVNALVPEGVAPGETVPVVVSAAGQSSPPVTMAVK
jgi:uncharacterized protein (TIGR03437 family)